MTASLLRLGDEIDDYCPRCKLLLNHAVASMVGSVVVKVVCQTCHTEHPYKNAEVPPKKKSGPRATLMDQVLAKVAPPEPEPAPEESPAEPEEAPEPVRKKSVATPARYITRHATRPPRGKR
jgi:mono/diheme cytochrome c family protein